MKSIWQFILILFLSLLTANGFSQTCTYGNCENGFGTFVYDDNSTISGFFSHDGKIDGYGMKKDADGTEYHGFLLSNEKNSWGLTRTPGSSAYTLSFHSKDSIPSIEIEIDGTSFKVFHLLKDRRVLVDVRPGCLIGDCSKADTTKWYVYQKEFGNLFAYGSEYNEASGKGILFKEDEMLFMDGTEPTGKLFNSGVYYFGSFNNEFIPHGYGVILSNGKVQYSGNFNNGSYQENKWSEHIPVPVGYTPYTFLNPPFDVKMFYEIEVELKLMTPYHKLKVEITNNWKELLKAISVSFDGLKAEQLESGSFNSKIQVLGEGSTKIRSAGLSTRIRGDEYIEIKTPEIFNYSEAYVVATISNIGDYILEAIPGWQYETNDAELVLHECENKNEGRQIIIHKPDISILKNDNLTSVKIWVVQNSSNYCDDTLVARANETSVSISRPLTEQEQTIVEAASRSLTSSQHIETIQQLHSIFSDSEDIKSDITGSCDEENGTCTSTLNLSDLGFSGAQVLLGDQPGIRWESPIVSARDTRRIDDGAVAEVVIKNYADRLEEIIPELSGFNKSPSVGFDENKAEPTISYISRDTTYRINLWADYVSNGRLKLYLIKMSVEKKN